MTTCNGELTVAAESDGYGSYLVVECGESCGWSKLMPSPAAVRYLIELAAQGHQAVHQ